MQRSLFRYFDNRHWAEEFIEGRMLFRALSYYRDHEADDGVREDAYEGTAAYQPSGGLMLNNHTQGIVAPFHGSLESSVNEDDVFVLCASRTSSVEQWDKFHAVACVEITRPVEFCLRVANALPSNVRFAGRPGKTRIGHRVEYYDLRDSVPFNPNWAVPGHIATAKRREYEWQTEFRLLFSLTNALDFQNVTMRLMPDGVERREKKRRRDEYPRYPVTTAVSLGDICLLRDVK